MKPRRPVTQHDEKKEELNLRLVKNSSFGDEHSRLPIRPTAWPLFLAREEKQPLTNGAGSEAGNGNAIPRSDRNHSESSFNHALAGNTLILFNIHELPFTAVPEGADGGCKLERTRRGLGEAVSKTREVTSTPASEFFSRHSTQRLQIGALNGSTVQDIQNCR